MGIFELFLCNSFFFYPVCPFLYRGDIGRMRNIVALDNVLVEQLNENPFRHVNYEIGSQPYACKEEYFHTIRSDR